jgi:hypothetical protein
MRERHAIRIIPAVGGDLVNMYSTMAFETSETSETSGVSGKRLYYSLGVVVVVVVVVAVVSFSTAIPHQIQRDPEKVPDNLCLFPKTNLPRPRDCAASFATPLQTKSLLLPGHLTTVE